MKLIYIAGPFRGSTPWDVECNVRRAEALGLEVARLGAMPIIPHANTRFFDKQCTDAFWLEGTLRLLAACDALLLTRDWAASAGARGEVAEMQRLGRPIFLDLRSLGEWLREAVA